MKRFSWFSRTRAIAGPLLTALCFTVAGCSHTVPQQGPGNRPPNIVFILVDDLGWADLGIQGSSFYETPNIDRLATEGIRFTDAYAVSPVCSPTRAAILTGKHPARLKITNWIPGDDPQDRRLLGPQIREALPLEELTLAEALKGEGYATFHAGKWHLGDAGHYPEDQGFDINKGGINLGRPPGGYYSPYSNPALTDGPDGEYLTDRLTTDAIEFIERNRARPFFIYLSFYAVHTPLQGADRYIDKFRDKLAATVRTRGPEQKPEHAGFTKQHQDNVEYASMVHALDDNVGRLMQAVKDLGLQDNTTVIFTSDNGGRSTLYTAGDATSNLPLRAGKGWVYEGGVRVPLIVHAPGGRSQGSVSSVPVTSMDFYPTILDIVGISAKPEQHVDGQSFKPVLDGQETNSRDRLYFYFPHYHGSASLPSAAVRWKNWKLVKFFESGEAELYDLGQDMRESRNLADAYPERVKIMEADLESWLQSVSAARPIANTHYVEGEEKLRFRGLEPQ